MILEISKAILHRCDKSAGHSVHSEVMLDLTDTAISEYIQSLIDKAIQSPALKKAVFSSNSGLYAKLQEYDSTKESSFIDLSNEIANIVDEVLWQAEKIQSIGLLICEVKNSARKVTYLSILKLDTKSGYLLTSMNTDTEVENTVHQTSSIMPLRNQQLNDYAFINLSEFSIKYASKKYMIGGERVDFMAECILGCQRETASSKEINSAMKSLIQKMSENPVESTVEVKKLISDKLTKSEDSEDKTYTFDEVAKRIFNSPTQREDFIAAAKQRYEVIGEADEKIALDDYTIKKTTEKLKIVTDTGIEIKFPHTVYGNQSKFDIILEDDGTYTVSIKGVQEYELK